MPISIALPPSTVEFFSELRYPLKEINNNIGDNCELDDFHVRQVPGTKSQAGEIDLAPSGGLSANTPDWGQLGGRLCAHLPTDAANNGASLRPTRWSPGYDASDFAAGAFYDPGSVVAVIDIHAALGATAFPGTAVDLASGFTFLNDIPGGGEVFGTPPNAGAGIGGFGIFAEDDGGGDTQWRFVAYDAGTTLTSVVVPVDDVTRWSTFRFTILRAAEGEDATLSLEVNGTNAAGVQALAFDDVELPRPRTISTAVSSFNWQIGYANGANMSDMFFQFYGRFGRFTASGQEVQGV